MPVDEDEVIYLPSAHDGLLSYATRTLRGSVELEQAWVSRAKNPIPTIDLHETIDTGMERDERQLVVDDWAKARSDPNGAIASTPYNIEARVLGSLDPQMFIEARNASRLDVANFFQIPASALDATTATASLTYVTQESGQNSIDSMTIPYWVRPLEDRLSQDDVLPIGHITRFAWAEALHRAARTDQDHSRWSGHRRCCCTGRRGPRRSARREHRGENMNGVGYFTLDQNTRTLRGHLLPWGVKSKGVSSSKTEPITFPRGHVRIPRDPVVVSLNDEHERHNVIGRATALRDDDIGIYAEFTLADDDEADVWLAEHLDEPVYLSAEVADMTRAPGDIGAGRLAGAAVTKAPAFDGTLALFSLLGTEEAATFREEALFNAQKVAATFHGGTDDEDPDSTPVDEDTEPAEEQDEPEEDDVAEAPVAPTAQFSRKPKASTPALTKAGFFAAMRHATRTGDMAALRPYLADAVGEDGAGLFALNDIKYDGTGGLAADAGIPAPGSANSGRATLRAPHRRSAAHPGHPHRHRRRGLDLGHQAGDGGVGGQQGERAVQHPDRVAEAVLRAAASPVVTTSLASTTTSVSPRSSTRTSTRWSTPTPCCPTPTRSPRSWPAPPRSRPVRPPRTRA